jgi:hypothetical protein
VAKRLFVALAAVGLLSAALGQTAGSKPDSPAALAVKAAVWGQVARPGLYQMEGSPDLFELLSRAGGPTSSADLANLLLVRERDGTRRRVNVNRLAASGAPLFLTSGDVLIVPESFWSNLGRNLPVISSLAVVANLAITIVLLVQR